MPLRRIIMDLRKSRKVLRASARVVAAIMHVLKTLRLLLQLDNRREILVQLEITKVKQI